MRVLCQLADFTDLCRLVGETGSRIAKAGFLRDYLAGLESDEDLRTIVQWLSAEAGPPRADRMPPATLRHALAAMPGGRAERFREIHHTLGETTRAARQFLQELHLEPAAVSLAETARFLSEFRENPRSLERVNQLVTRLATLHPAEGETLIGLLCHTLHLGIDTALLEMSIAEAFECDADDLRTAILRLQDPGAAAVLARHHRLAVRQG
jgi:DNA ligase-1